MLHKIKKVEGLYNLKNIAGNCMTFHLRKDGEPLLLISSNHYYDYISEGKPLENAVLEMGSTDVYPRRKINNFFIDNTIIKESEKRIPGQILSKSMKINLFRVKYGKSLHQDDFIFTTLSRSDYISKLLELGVEFIGLSEESKNHSDNSVFAFMED